MAGRDWKPGAAMRFPSISVTRGAARNNEGSTYYFNGRTLVDAISEGMFGAAAADVWSASRMTTHHVDIAGIFRALDRGSFEFEVIHIPTVMDRDGWRCHLCGDPIDPALTHGRDRNSLDHVVPIARGGGHTYDNVKASHWRCNHSKGARMKNEQL